ncbi:DMT family transporter [Paeniglutamicibacter psychrophenolicus]|uniref:Transporter family-2 protein n=1 Tax=Paeniglutamicibacter psychrophenolicus TaxID=257454 RepID=A0ABS4WIJ7_9MICC|nr:transporter family-2 protein [Paeniglutamicibacter psychrophenolicus]
MARPEPRSHAVPLALAGSAGMLMPLQALITSNAAGFLGGYFAAALISALTSLACLMVASIALPGARAGWRKFGSVWRERQIPRWFLLAGLVGAYYMVAQAMSVSNIGLALFAVAVVGARTLTSIVIDVIGFSPAGKQPVTRIRILGAALLVVGAVIASWGTGARSAESPLAWASLAVAMGAGLLVSFQQSMNGRAGQAYGSTTTATAINYLASTAGLLIAMAVLALLKIESFGFTSVPLWWMYLAGPLGILFVVTGVTLVPRLGALVLGIGLVTGQLAGSLAMDLILTPEKVGVNEIIGTLVTLLAVLVASWQPNGRPRWKTRKTP